jgi:hypothetical protein
LVREPPSGGAQSRSLSPRRPHGEHRKITAFFFGVSALNSTNWPMVCGTEPRPVEVVVAADHAATAVTAATARRMKISRIPLAERSPGV